MTRAVPICLQCAYARWLTSRFPMCAHPEAARNPVDGKPDRACLRERLSPGSFCGPDGNGFWPLAQVGKPGVDGVGQPVNGV